MRGKRNRQILTVVVALLAVAIVGFLVVGMVSPGSWPGRVIRGSAIQTEAKAPTYGTATVDGDYGEWDLVEDLFSDMHRAWDSNKPVETRLYLRYDCGEGVLYALVLSAGDWPVEVAGGNDEAWIKIDGTKVTFDDFAWINQGYDGDDGHAQGWEASFSLAQGSYVLNAQTNVYNDGESQTSGIPDQSIGLTIDCSAVASIGDLAGSTTTKMASRMEPTSRSTRHSFLPRLLARRSGQPTLGWTRM
jgi:hypothetical protein